MQGLTDRQAQAFAFIKSSIETRGYPPTIREIGAHMGIRSTNGVGDHLKALERKGYIVRADMLSRGIRLAQPGADRAAAPAPETSAAPASDQVCAVDVFRRITGAGAELQGDIGEVVKIDPRLLDREPLGYRARAVGGLSSST